MGDPSKLILLDTALDVIKRENLIAQACVTGEYLKRGLHALEKDFCCLINSVRGRGTILAFNAAKPELRDQILVKLKQKGKDF